MTLAPISEEQYATLYRLARRMEAALRAQEEFIRCRTIWMQSGDIKGTHEAMIAADEKSCELRRAILAELDQGKEPK